MHGVWIYQKDKNSYVSLMNEYCGGPHVLQETEDKLQVDFCNAAMTAWVQSGHWYGFE